MPWPSFVPFAILLVETSRRRRRAIGAFQVLGIGVGLYLLYFIVRFPVTARVFHRSIFYDSPHFFIKGALVAYLLATCVSGLFSSHRCINAFGVLTFVLAVAAYEVSAKTFFSVWFALLFAVPLIDRNPRRWWRRRPLAMVIAGLVLATIVALSVLTLTTSAVSHLG